MTEQLLVHPEDLDWFYGRYGALSWRFAETMASVPHSYVVRGRSWSEAEHVRAFGVLRTFGVPGKFHERTNIYLHQQETDHRWWPMTRHHWQTKIINMATDGRMYGKQDAPSTANDWFAPYDHVAAYYEDLYLPTDQSERIHLWKVVESMLPARKPRTLDLGAGNGGTLDAKVCGAPDTTAVDISQGMLNDLVMKHPKIGRILPTSAEEYLSWQTGETFELVTASFGSASYLSPEAILALPSICTGAIVLSFNRRGFRAPMYGIEELSTFAPEDAEAIEAARSLKPTVVEERGNYVTYAIRGGA